MEDRAEVEATLNALSASLYSEASKGPFSVMRLFAQGCRLVLGFPEVFFWRWDKAWTSFDIDVFPWTLPHGDVSRMLPSPGAVSPDWLPLPPPWSNQVAAMLLDAPPPDQSWAVTVSDLQGRSVITRERERLLRQLFRHLREAQGHAVKVERDRARLTVRDRHVEILNSIFDSLGRQVLNTRHVLAMAARGLRTLGYRRVFFCLVDPKRERIHGGLDDSDDASVDIGQMTDWPLSDPLADLQPYIVHTGQYKIVDEASQEPLANKEVVRAARMKSLAIVPIFSQTSVVVGTIHVERQDGAVPTGEEVEDLIVFGRQLATAIEQSERVNLLQSGLDLIPEPVLIADSLEQCRYANKPAADLLGLPPGWRDRDEAQILPDQGTQDLQKYLRESLSGRRVFHHFTGIGSQPTYRGALLADRIQNWRQEVIGGLLHIEDMNYLHRVLEAFRAVAAATDTTSAMQAMLDAAKLLGHKLGRLYRIDELDPDRFLSKLSYGFEDPEAQRKFNQGLINLPRRHEPSFETWKSIQERIPIVFCYRPDLVDGTPLHTLHGLDVLAVRDPHCPEELEKKPGQFWIDIPLLSSERDLGKFTLQCDEDLPPEQFALLKVLYDMAAELLAAFIRRDRAAAEHDRAVREAYEKSISIISHSILTQIGSFSPLLRLLRDEEGDLPALKALNDMFDGALTRVQTTARRTKKMLSAVVPQAETFDLLPRLKAAAQAALPGRTRNITCAADSVLIIGDPHLLESVFLELFNNSREMAPDYAKLRVEVFVETFPGPSGDRVRITYTDNGPGVPHEFKDRIFDDFFSRRPGRNPSTGLGLSYVRRVITAHGGTISENGTPGQGARFVIEIPAAIPAPRKD